MIPSLADGLEAAAESTPLVAAGPKQVHSAYIYVVALLSAIGGFLFGYDTGIISGAMIFVRDEFQLNEWWQEAVVSSTLLAAWLFSLLAGPATSRLGRKPVILFSSFVFVLGSALMALARSRAALLLGRLVVGGAVGLASMTVPMYIAEVAPSSIRGQLLMLNMCCVTGGQFFASCLAYWLSLVRGNQGWRYMLGFGALPGAVQLLAFLLVPESPRWLAGELRHEDARRALRKLRPAKAHLEPELEAIFEAERRCRLARQQQQQTSSTWARIRREQPVRKALLVGCLLQLVQQLSGINTVMYYSASIFQMAGVHSKRRALLLSAATALINFVFTLVGYALVERAGRRRLTLLSLAGVVASLALLGAGFQFAYINSAPVSEPELSPSNAACAALTTCARCTQQPSCGFCFDAAGASSCLLVNSSNHELSALGACSRAGPDPTRVWALDWCPSSYSWLTLLGMALYLLSFAPGMGPMPWTINSEIYPSWARSWCLSASTSVNWLANLAMSMSFLTLTRAITKFGAFYLYALLAALGLAYFYCVLPETRGKSLEQLEEVFASEQYLDEKRRRAKSSACG